MMRVEKPSCGLIQKRSPHAIKLNRPKSFLASAANVCLGYSCLRAYRPLKPFVSRYILFPLSVLPLFEERVSSRPMSLKLFS